MSRNQSENYEKKYNVVCKYYLAGKCTRTKCNFLHQKQNPSNQLVNSIQETLDDIKTKLNPVSRAILFRRPLLHMVVLFANDREVRSYSEEVEEQFIHAGINVFTQYYLGDGTKQFIKPEHLVEIITASSSRYLVVIGDRNMHNNTCSAKISGKLVAVPVSEHIQTIQDEWQKHHKESLDESAKDLSKEQLQQWIESLCGINHIKPRISKLRNSTDKLKSKGVPDVSDVPLGANIDKHLLDEFTRTQNSVIKLHQEILNAQKKISQIPIVSNDNDDNDGDDENSHQGFALHDFDPETELGISEPMQNKLIDECNNILNQIEELGSQLSDLTNTTSLWGSYINEPKKDLDDHSDTENKWQCARCTYLNPNSKQKCSICDHPRHAKISNEDDDEWISTNERKKKSKISSTNESSKSATKKKKKKPKKKPTHASSPQQHQYQHSVKQQQQNKPLSSTSPHPSTSATQTATGTVHSVPSVQSSPPPYYLGGGVVSVPRNHSPGIRQGNPWSVPPNIGSRSPTTQNLPSVDDDEEFPSLGETANKKKKKKKKKNPKSSSTSYSPLGHSPVPNSDSYTAPNTNDMQYNPSAEHTLFQPHYSSAFTPKHPSPRAVGSPAPHNTQPSPTLSPPPSNTSSPANPEYLSTPLQEMKINDGDNNNSSDHGSHVNYFQTPFSTSRFSQPSEISNVWNNNNNNNNNIKEPTNNTNPVETTTPSTRSSTPESSSSFGNLNDQGIPSFSAFMPLGNSFSAFQTTGTQGWDRILSPSGSQSDTPSPSPIDGFGPSSLYSNNSPTPSQSSSTSPSHRSASPSPMTNNAPSSVSTFATTHSASTSSPVSTSRQDSVSWGGNSVFNQTAAPFYAPQPFYSQYSQTTQGSSPSPSPSPASASVSASSRRFVSQPCVICGSESMFECNHCANMRRRGMARPPVFFCCPEHQDTAWRQGIHKH